VSYKNLETQLEPLIRQLQRENYEFIEDHPETIKRNREALINRSKAIHKLKMEPIHEVRLTRFKSLIKE